MKSIKLTNVNPLGEKSIIRLIEDMINLALKKNNCNEEIYIEAEE